MAFPVQAAKGDFTFGLDGGMSVPTGDYGDVAKSGFLGGVFGDYQIHDMFAVGLDGAYSQNKAKGTDVGDAKATIIQFGGHVKVMPQMKDMPVLPYLQVGAGLYNAKFSGGGSDTTVNKFGYNVGIGADYKVNPQIGVGLFGTFHSALSAFELENEDGTTSEKAANYIAVGVKVTFMTTGATTK
jgi:opacity protein-like surface antigen